MKTLVQHILEKYGFHARCVHAVQKGYRNQSWHMTLLDGHEVNIIIYKSESDILAKIKNAHAISAFLAQQGFPVRQTIDERIMCLRGTNTKKYAALYTYLPGTTIPWEAYTQKHIKLLGKTLSDMHSALSSYDASTLPNVIDEYRLITHRMERYFNNPAIAEAIARKLEVKINPHALHPIQHTLIVIDSLTSKQPLHMDFVRGNVLFGGSGETLTISGILDFEKTALGHPIVDIARTLAFLLVDCKYKSEEKVRKYFLYSGYNKRGTSKLSHIKLLEPLIDLFLLYDFYKFLRHNPYEYLEQNEHFVRTRELLIKRGRILYT